MKPLCIPVLLLAILGCRNPQQAAIYTTQGMGLAVRGPEFEDRAEQYFTLALEADATWWPALYARGTQRLRRGDAHGAVADLERACAEAPDDAGVLEALAEARRRTTRP